MSDRGVQDTNQPMRCSGCGRKYPTTAGPVCGICYEPVVTVETYYSCSPPSYKQTGESLQPRECPADRQGDGE